jgi:hypothetical protein
MKTFEGKSKLPEDWWPSVAPTPSANAKGVPGICSDLIGTDAVQFHQFVNAEERLWVFNSDICRSIWFDYYQAVDLRGIKLLRFRAAADVFDYRNKNNYCYCPEVGQSDSPTCSL